MTTRELVKSRRNLSLSPYEVRARQRAAFLSRRSVIAGAASLALARQSRAWTHGQSSAPAYTVRAVSPGMRTGVVAFIGASRRSMTTRSPHQVPVRFRRSKVILQVFYPLPNPTIITDTLFTGASAVLRFQVAFEASFLNALTGIPGNRPAYLFSGANFVQYDNATWNGAIGHIESDWLDHGGWIAASQMFGLHTTVELPASAANAIPSQRFCSSFVQRFGGTSLSTSSQISNYGGASDVALNATSYTAWSSSQAGTAQFFTPCAMLIETDSASPHILTIADSLGEGYGEGTGSSDTQDVMGDANMNAGWIDRGLFNAGFSFLNLSKKGDANLYLANPTNWKYRYQLAQLSGATHGNNGNFVNDIVQTTTLPSSWVTGTPYAQWTVIKTASNCYLATSGGTSGATGPTGTGSGIIDGGVTWAWIGGITTVEQKKSAVFGNMVNVNNQILTAVPGIKLFNVAGTPATTDPSGNWAAAPGTQSPQGGWGNSASERGLLNALIRGGNSLLSPTGYLDPSAFYEYTYPTETSLFIANGVAFYATPDGTHITGIICASASGAITSSTYH